ncbi:hypothetical protein H8B15_02265 [Hymenobacter sp. BT507]|uniref:DUF5103 domain-containing protein n=1 Tax=Hymenobacter citatus TaxID=2763506 RepID=A0ABR7MF65_9BACT|nr:hypothetical protein [Hymenobacter citatus]MBC6609729.1 hypothetical protein [Hymenobacter citatus]
MQLPTIFSALIASLCLALTSCEPKPDVEYVPIVFEIPMTVSPLRDTIAVGDTLWLTASFPDSIMERTTQMRYRVTPQDFDFKTGFSLRQFVDAKLYFIDQPGFTTGFTVINKVGSATITSQRFGRLFPTYGNGHYRMRIGLVARQKGVACLSIQDGAKSLGVYEPEPNILFLNLSASATGHPRQPTYATTHYTINEGKTNFHLFQQHCTPIPITNPTEDNMYYEQKDTYTFVVK